ncbi:metalloregulator ArsR/SmtB family transcription factor [Granulicella sp. dw_53]|uniref:ArsR/SmtB family transcription factor n=1 Tax=Granulicella sp. dw_53 TaxID=2719792 RepID=UPI001BD44E8A|nr:metalloregulator ArsR/SmtB family transcription factor [Granulicella sp. dw_53]
MSRLPLSDKMLDLVARRFRTLGEPFRLRLLQSLEQGEKTVGELVQLLDGHQPNVSKHLQILHDAGLVSRRRDANSILYAISDPMVFKLCELVCRSAEKQTRKDYELLHPPLQRSKRG